jgi:large subunit ribosomal protein L15
VRLLAKGELTTKASFKVAGVSKGASAAIESLGGNVELIVKVRAEKAPKEKAGSKKTA